MLAGSRMYMYMYICTCTCTCSCLHAHLIVVVSTTRTCRLPAATCVPMHVSTRICTCTCTSCVHAHRERRAHHAQICMEAQGEALTQHGILFLINSLSHSSPSLIFSLTHSLSITHSLTAREPRQVVSTGCAAEHVLQHVPPRKLTALSTTGKSDKLSTWIDNLKRFHRRRLRLRTRGSGGGREKHGR